MGSIHEPPTQQLKPLTAELSRHDYSTHLVNNFKTRKKCYQPPMNVRDRFSSQKSLKPSCTNLYEKPPDSEQTIIALLRTISYRFPARYPTIHDLPHPWRWVTVVTVEVATHLYYLNLCPYICDFISPRVVTTRF